MEKPILLSIVVPNGQKTELRCDSVRFRVPDGEKKSNPGGSVGIRKGHANALMALAPGDVTAMSDGDTVFVCHVDGGFASIGGDRVTILTGCCSIIKQ